jgi:hypothetical protein
MTHRRVPAFAPSRMVEHVLRFAQDFGSGLGCPPAPQVWSEATKLKMTSIRKLDQRAQLGAGGSGIDRMDSHRHCIVQ